MTLTKEKIVAIQSANKICTPIFDVVRTLKKEGCSADEIAKAMIIGATLSYSDPQSRNFTAENHLKSLFKINKVTAEMTENYAEQYYNIVVPERIKKSSAK